MSRPANPLARYRTYSYHHILVACDNDIAASYLSQTSSLDAFSSIGVRRSIESQRADLRVEPTDEFADRLYIGNYVVITNGLIDTEFVIQEARWFTTTAASTDQTDSYNSIAVEGKIILQEPGGVRFFNVMNNTADALRTDPTGIIFVLKTIFVGHRDDGETDYITTVKPLRFLMYDITGTFDVTGGVYEISFVGIDNGAARLPQFSRGAELVRIKPTPYINIETVMTRLQDEMNRLSLENRDCLVEQIKSVYGNPTRTTEDGQTESLDSMRPVTYEIIVDDAYKQPGYVLNNWNARQADDVKGNDEELENGNAPSGVQGESSPMPFPEKCTVEQAIRYLLERCERVLKDRTEGDENGIKYIYKIHSQISMVDRDDEGTVQVDGTKRYDEVRVKYFIRRFAQVTNQSVEQLIFGDGEQNLSDEQRQAALERNSIEFDYFYTGKNIDIDTFDIKMEMGLTFLQTLATSNSIATQIEQIQGTKVANTSVAINANAKGDAVPEGQDPKILVRNRTPIFPVTKVKDVLLRHSGNPKDTTLFQSYLARHAALENIEAKLTILGNPYLLSQVNRPAGDVNRKDDRNDPGDEESVLVNWHRQPALAKVNIFMPLTNDTPSSDERFERTSFWYNGYYYLYGIEHIFTEGEFKQQLDMISIPNESLIEEQNKEEYLEACGGKKQNSENTETNQESGQVDEPTAGDRTRNVGRSNPFREISSRGFGAGRNL